MFRNMLPSDPMILLSFVNTKLRDDYSDLDSLCDALGVSPDEITEPLAGLGYKYDADQNQFK